MFNGDFAESSHSFDSIFAVIEPEVGGWGASHLADGNTAIFSGIHGDTFNLEAEIAEARNGVYVDKYALNDDSGGELQFRSRFDKMRHVVCATLC